ncbi:MAG: hypothetical protein IIV13_00900 [Bacteroidaceae bacterium]|nr:hypothetical protein [Bacteroidaceae bacterium]
MSTYKRDDELMPFSYQPYQKSDAVKQADDLLRQHAASKPSAYQSRYQTDMDSLMSQIQNRKPFRYDVNGDALYQQYKDRFIHNGQRAMQDTMGQAAALTGGYGSSYAQNVGQQAYNEYMTGLNDVIPELYQLALDKYERETARLQDQYAMLADLDARDYSRHQDDQNAYYAELERLTENAHYAAEQDYGRYTAGYDAAYKKYQADAEAAAEQQAAEATPLEKYKFAGVDDNGNYRYYKGDKQATYAQGINPYTGDMNPDVKNGTFGQSGYQPDNIGGEKLTWTGQTAMMNGHKQKVWQLPDGKMYLWDDTVNGYVPYKPDGYSIGASAGTAKFKDSVPSRSAYGGGQGYQEYIENKIDEWLDAGKLTDDEAATLLRQYGFA